MNRIQTIIAALLATAAMTAVHAQELRVASTAPEKSPWGVWLTGVADKAAKLSDGKLKLNVFFGGQLGDEQTTMNLASRGRIDIAAVTTIAASLLEPGVEAIHMPFVWENDKQFDCAVDQYLSPMIGKMLADKGVVPIAAFEVPAFVMFSKTKVERPADLAGKSWRAVPTRVSVGFLNAVGAHAVALGNPDMVTSLQTGGVAGAETSGLFGISLGIHKVAPNILLTRHARVVANLFVSQRTWDKLSEENRKILIEAASDTASIRSSVRGAENGLIGKVAQEGVTVVELSDAARKEWQQAASAAYPALLKEIGGRANEVWATIGDAKKACPGK